MAESALSVTRSKHGTRRSGVQVQYQYVPMGVIDGMADCEPDLPEATNTDLLIGLQDWENDSVWTSFCARYRPVLVLFGRRLGLDEPDAHDAAQEALTAFAEAYRKGAYDRKQGRLRRWLFAIASHKIRNLQRQNYGQRGVVDWSDKTKWLNSVPDEHSMSQIWEAQWQRAVLDACLGEVYSKVELSTIQAFQLYVLEEWPVDKVADHLGMTQNAVLKAARRVLTRLREAYNHLNVNW